MASKDYHRYCVILADGSREEVIARDLDWKQEGPDRILELEGMSYSDKQGQIVNPLGVHRIEKYVELPVGEAAPEDEDEA